MIPTTNTHYTFRNSDKVPFFKSKYIFFNSFFPSVIIEWNKLDPSLRRCHSYNVFKSNILKFIWPSSNSFFDCHNPIGIKYISRLHVFDLELVICESINSNTAFRIHSILYVTAVFMLNELFIFSSTVS